MRARIPHAWSRLTRQTFEHTKMQTFIETLDRKPGAQLMSRLWLSHRQTVAYTKWWIDGKALRNSQQRLLARWCCPLLHGFASEGCDVVFHTFIQPVLNIKLHRQFVWIMKIYFRCRNCFRDCKQKRMNLLHFEYNGNISVN